MGIIDSIEKAIENWINRQILWAFVLVLIDLNLAWGILAAIGYFIYSLLLLLPTIVKVVSVIGELIN